MCTRARSISGMMLSYHTFPLFSFYSSRFTANLLGWNIQSLNPIGRFQMMTKLIGRHLIRFTLVLVKVWMVMTYDYLKNQRQIFVSHELKVLITLFHNWLCFKEILKNISPIYCDVCLLNLCKIELEKWNFLHNFSTQHKWNGTFQTICFFRSTVISRLSKNTRLCDNSNSFQSKMLYNILIFKWSYLDSNLWICNFAYVISFPTEHQLLVKILAYRKYHKRRFKDAPN